MLCYRNVGLVCKRGLCTLATAWCCCLLPPPCLSGAVWEAVPAFRPYVLAGPQRREPWHLCIPVHSHSESVQVGGGRPCEACCERRSSSLTQALHQALTLLAGHRSGFKSTGLRQTWEILYTLFPAFQERRMLSLLLVFFLPSFIFFCFAFC